MVRIEEVFGLASEAGHQRGAMAYYPLSSNPAKIAGWRRRYAGQGRHRPGRSYLSYWNPNSLTRLCLNGLTAGEFVS